MNRRSIIFVLLIMLVSCAPLDSQAASTPTVEPSVTPSPPPTEIPSPTATPDGKLQISCPTFVVEITGTAGAMPTDGKCTQQDTPELTLNVVEVWLNNTDGGFGLIFSSSAELIAWTDNVEMDWSDDGITATLTVEGAGTLTAIVFIQQKVEGVLQSQKAPQFTVHDTDNVAHSLKDQGKNKILYFWFSTCPYCAEDLPKIIDAVENSNDVTLFLFNDKESQNVAATYLSKFSLNHGIQVTQADSAVVAKQYAVFGYPVTILIGPDGVVKYHAVGPIDIEKVKSLLSE